MMNRRDLVLGAACLAAAGTAVALQPRRHLSLLGNRKMEAIVPAAFGSWTSRLDANLIQPDLEGSLQARLYNETMSRVYDQSVTGDQVMMLIAYGANQSDLLQLHRPEACYPAVGFRVLKSETRTVLLRDGALLPCRRVVVDRSDRREHIVYWTRLGEFLPTSPGGQRKARLATAMQGYVADGGLFRCSRVGTDEAEAFQSLERFVSQLVQAVAPRNRPALVGSSLARQLNI